MCMCECKIKTNKLFWGWLYQNIWCSRTIQGVITSPHILHFPFLKHLIPSHPALCLASYTASISFPISLFWGPFCTFHYHSHSMLSFRSLCVFFYIPCVSYFVKYFFILFDLTIGNCIVQIAHLFYIFVFQYSPVKITIYITIRTDHFIVHVLTLVT